MAVSKRLRFEVFKRDNNTCQYCGRSAPEVVLQIDHIHPTSLGGDDSPRNLLTACRDCNAGKSSSSPRAPKVDPPNVDGLRWRKAVESAASDQRRYRDREREACEAFEQAWPWASPPDDWKKDIAKFVRLGLVADDMVHILEKALDRATGYQHAWLYFCKVCWAEVKLIRSRAEEALALEPVPAFGPEPDVDEVVYEDFRPEPPPFYAPLPTTLVSCIECDERQPGDDGLCDACRRNLYEGLA